jgi:hypothetical protein
MTSSFGVQLCFPSLDFPVLANKGTVCETSAAKAALKTNYRSAESAAPPKIEYDIEFFSTRC